MARIFGIFQSRRIASSWNPDLAHLYLRVPLSTCCFRLDEGRRLLSVLICFSSFSRAPSLWSLSLSGFPSLPRIYRNEWIPYRYFFCWCFGANVICWMRAECGQNSLLWALDFLRHLTARIRIMNEIIEISQPAPSSCQEIIMNGPIGAVHGDKE